MKQYIQDALAVEMNPKDFDDFFSFANDFHDQIQGIVLHAKEADTDFTVRCNETMAALSPAAKLVFCYMDLLNSIRWDGLTTSLLNLEGGMLEHYRGMMELSESKFLQEQLGEAIRLFTKKYNPVAGENFWSHHSQEDLDDFFATSDMERIEEIGDEIDNWEGEDIEKAFFKIAQNLPESASDTPPASIAERRKERLRRNKPTLTPEQIQKRDEALAKMKMPKEE